MSLREKLAAISYTAKAWSDDPAEAWIIAASVLDHFDPVTLETEQGRLSPASQAMADLMAASQPVAGQGTRARRLLAYERNQRLRALGSREAIAGQLELNSPPDTATQRAFLMIVHGAGAHALLKVGGLDDIAGLLEAVGWLEGALEDLPMPMEIEHALERARFLDPFRGLVGEQLAGRKEELDELESYMSDPEAEEVLMLQGPGGVGKSTVLAKFVLDHLSNAVSDTTVLFLDLDNPGLVVEDPFTLIEEALRQLRLQHPSISGLLTRQRGYLASIRARSTASQTLESLSDNAVDWNEVADVVTSIIEEVPGDGRVLLILDTFEEAQSDGQAAVERIYQLIRGLSRSSPRLRTVIAGRVGEPRASDKTITIDAFDEESSRTVLAKAAGERPLPVGLADEVFRITEGIPLATALAGRLIAKGGADALEIAGLQKEISGKLQSEQIQAGLYDRLLDHVGDERVRRLVYQGLAVRRINPDILRHVLAGPCEVEIEDALDAERLYRLMEQETALMEPDPDGLGVRHWPDLRRFMLRHLRADQPVKVAEVDDLAVAYYRTQPGPLARAEEIYHLLAGGRMPTGSMRVGSPASRPILLARCPISTVDSRCCSPTVSV